MGALELTLGTADAALVANEVNGLAALIDEVAP